MSSPRIEVRVCDVHEDVVAIADGYQSEVLAGECEGVVEEVARTLSRLTPAESRAVVRAVEQIHALLHGEASEASEWRVGDECEFTFACADREGVIRRIGPSSAHVRYRVAPGRMSTVEVALRHLRRPGGAR